MFNRKKRIEQGFTDRLVGVLKSIIPARIIPKKIFDRYHLVLAFLGHLVYGFPSRKLIVFGVTGTKGKTTTSYFLAQLLERAGFRVALSSTVYFQIGDKRWKNETKMGLPGRFFLPRFLSEAVRSGCQIAVIETGSEAILQNRHRFVDYDYAVFTNLAPEHIERHGGFENYKKAKMKLLEGLENQKIKKSKNHKEITSSAIVNLGSEYAKVFLNAAGKAKKTGVTLGLEPPKDVVGLCDSLYHFSSDANAIRYKDHQYPFSLPGNFNIENAALAATATATLTGDLPRVLEQLHTLKLPEGRVEIIERGGVSVVIDYAHEPYSVEHILSWVRDAFKGKPMIHVFGSQGGGRDVWKRAAMGGVSARFSDVVIVTNEDPYTDPPEKIIDDVALGVGEAIPVQKIIDRTEAIRSAIKIAKERKGVVVLTGKGSETVMCIGNEMIPWSDRETVNIELGKICA